MYLKLLHGRHDPEADMDGMGVEGPAIGPLEWVHGTYMSTIRVWFRNPTDMLKFPIIHDGIHAPIDPTIPPYQLWSHEPDGDARIEVDGEFLKTTDGMYWGDWEMQDDSFVERGA